MTESEKESQKLACAHFSIRSSYNRIAQLLKLFRMSSDPEKGNAKTDFWQSPPRVNLPEQGRADEL
jgi:hypothetical protein